MIHELIDPKKKTNKATASRNTKTLQEPKTVSEEINYEGIDSENKESSSTIFIPPWLRNSLGLNQRNSLNLDWNLCLPNFTALGPSTGTSDIKSAKVNQRTKEPNHNELELKANVVQQDCCKKATERLDILPQECAQEVTITRGLDGVETSENNNDRTIPIYWDVKRKQSETEWSCANAETKTPKKEESKMTDTDALAIAEVEKLKEEDKKRLKFFKQKNKMRKRATGDSKQSDLDKNEMDFLLEMKAREALDSYMKGEDRSVSSEMRHLEAKLLLLSAKTQEESASKINQQDIRVLQDVKNQGGSVEQLERVFEHVKDVNLRGIVRNSEFLSKEKKREDKEAMQKISEVKCKADKDSLLSTDDENDIKRFSEFLSKNKNVDEKRKCLEEVRNYFERKRRTRLTKRRYLEEAKQKLGPEPDRKDQELTKGKLKPRDIYRGRRSKFALCDEEIVEKAVDEALQKFVELYHFRVSPNVMGNMKKNILQAITSDSVDPLKLRECAELSVPGKRSNILSEKEPEKGDPQHFLEAEISEVPNKELGLPKEVKKKSGRNVNESSGENATKTVSEVEDLESDKLRRLKKEFDIFLHSVQAHIDVTNLKLQSIILEKEEQTAPAQNVQFVYNFTKKALETERADYWQSLREVLDLKKRKDGEAQTATDLEPLRRNIKIQTLDHKINCEQSLQTDNNIYVTQNTQTEGEGITVQEIKELKSHDVNPGLYRMVRSKEAGKFYLYPEQLDDGKADLVTKSNSSVVRDKKFNKKRNLVNVLSKERTKERQVFFKERDRGRLKKLKNAPVYAVAQVKDDATARKKDETSENSISCLFFRNLDKKGSGSNSSKKEIELTDENLQGSLDAGEDFGMSGTKVDHLGCFWFWDGEKINPGCDLKAHVEDLLQEKLTQLSSFAGEKGEESNGSNLAKSAYDQVLMRKTTEENIGLRNADALFCIGNVKNPAKENASALTQNESLDEKKRTSTAEEKKEDKEEVEETVDSRDSREKSVKNVGTQDSQLQFLSLRLSKHKSNSGTTTQVRRRCTRRNIVIKPAGKVVNLKKAEDFLRAVHEIRKMKMQLENSKKENSTDSESLMDCSTSTSCYKNPGEDPLSMVLGLKDNTEVEGISNSDIKDSIKKLISLVDREVQTEACDAEDGNSESQAGGTVLDSQKHLDLIGRVLSGVSQKQRESLWNDVRNFIKTKLGKDINDSGAREVCIEIEQDMPKTEQGKVKHSIFAKGHYMKNEGDVEVEIDLTLDDLARILCQRQRRNRRRNIYRSSKSKNLLSSSSAQSDVTRNDIRRCQKYLNKFAKMDLPQNKQPKTYKKSTGH